MKYTLASIACLVLLLLVFLYTDPYLNDPSRADDPYLISPRGRTDDYERDLARRNFATRMQKINDDLDSSFTKEDDVQLTAVPDYVRRVLVLAR